MTHCDTTSSIRYISVLRSCTIPYVKTIEAGCRENLAVGPWLLSGLRQC